MIEVMSVEMVWLDKSVVLSRVLNKCGHLQLMSWLGLKKCGCLP